MAWIKRNLYFVITVVLGLGVTGFCGYLLFSALDQNKADSDKYFSDKGNLENLQKKAPYPDQHNIQAAVADADRVRTFLDEFHKPFASFPQPPKLDDQQFKEHLQKTIMQFGAQATNAGVGLPPGCAFSFSSQMNVLNYASDSIAPWMQELTEIRAILQILYNAKINYLEKIKRPAVSGEEITSDDYTQASTTTNTWGVVKTPYMVNFRAFSAEIANVLAGIAASSNCFIVKTIYVSPSREPLPQLIDLQPPAPAPAPVPRYQYPLPEATPNPFMQQNDARRGFRERRPVPPPMQYATPVYQAPVAPAGPVTIVSETPLFVTLYIDVIKLKAPEKETQTPAAAPRPTRRAAR
jgi:hypothetical protein